LYRFLCVGNVTRLLFPMRFLSSGNRCRVFRATPCDVPLTSEQTMLQLYGNPRSRAMRCIWMLEEVGEPYQLIEKSTRVDDLQTADYLRLNPNARIPTLVDGDMVLWESMAINIYLSEKYDGPMHCGGT